MQPDFQKTAKALIEGVSRQVDKLFAPYATRYSEFEKRLNDLEARQPEPGPPGEKGEKGDSGVGMAGAVVDRNGVLIVTLSDGTAKELGPCIGKDGRDGIDGKDGQDGADGFNGDPGRGIIKAEVNDGGLLILTYSDGAVEETGLVVGAAGKDGVDGKDGIDGKDGVDGLAGKDGRDAPVITKTAIDDEGNLILTYGRFETNEFRDFNAGRVRGADGKDGEDGKDGAHGVSIDEAEIDKDGNLVVRFTDGTTKTVGPVKGPAGEKGMDAEPIDAQAVAEDVANKITPAVKALVDDAVAALPLPEDGKDGRDGVDGKDGRGIEKAIIDDNGMLVLKMTDIDDPFPVGVVKGKDGEPGRDGVDGVKGLDGRDGKDGRDGFSLDDFDVRHGDDSQTIILSFTKGDVTEEYELRFPVFTYEGVWAAGREYHPGNGVTWGGNVFIATEKTDKKPDGPGSGWKLAVRRGRDGKDSR